VIGVAVADPFSTIGACFRALSNAIADDTLLAKWLEGTPMSVAAVRNPRGWEDARPPSGALLSLVKPAVQQYSRNGRSPQELHEQQQRVVPIREPDPSKDSPFEFVLGSEINGAPYELHDMLVEHVLTASGISVVYGAANSGKTFLMLDLACAIARGVDWLGRYRVRQGAVLYLASEGPRSVKFRLQAYQHHYGQSVQLLAIVAEPVNLFASDIDARGIVSTIDAIERATGEPVRMVVGDTLAAMTPGANENHGTDMSVVLGNIDRVVTARPVHFALIHHVGKDEARGMRGWSGLNARTDTAVEVLDSNNDDTCHSAEIVKQRDIAGRREKITFDLRSVEVGVRDNFDNPITSCVVETTDKPAPVRRSQVQASKAGKGRPNVADGLVLGVLSTMPKGISRGELVRHFDGKPAKSTIYRSIENLIEAGKVAESAGIVRMLEASGSSKP